MSRSESCFENSPSPVDGQSQLPASLSAEIEPLKREAFSQVPVFEDDATAELASYRALPPSDPTRIVYEKVSPAVVKITCPIDDKQIAVGSGFFADSQGRIVTALHVVDTAAKPGDITIDTTDGRQFEATIEKVDFINDLAILKLEKTPSGIKHLEFGDLKHHKAGDAIYLLGHPHGMATTFATAGSFIRSASRLKTEILGCVNTSRVEWNGYPHNDYLLSAAPSRPGNSGGPLVDSNGAVLGVLDMDNGEDQTNQCLSVPARRVQDLLKTQDSAYKAGNANLPAQFGSSYLDAWHHRPLLTAGESAVFSYLAYQIPRLMPTLIPLECGAIGAIAAIGDTQALFKERTQARIGSHALAISSDAAMIAGTLGTLVWRRPTALTLTLTGLGLAGRIAAAGLPPYRTLAESAPAAEPARKKFNYDFDQTLDNDIFR